MTNEEAIKKIKAKLECMDRQTRGIFEECNSDMCDSCDLNYDQGNMRDQKETLRMVIKALEEQKTGKWVGIEYDGYADGNPVYDVYECSSCGYVHNGESDTLSDYCPDCGAKMEG